MCTSIANADSNSSTGKNVDSSKWGLLTANEVYLKVVNIQKEVTNKLNLEATLSCTFSSNMHTSSVRTGVN